MNNTCLLIADQQNNIVDRIKAILPPKKLDIKCVNDKAQVLPRLTDPDFQFIIYCLDQPDEVVAAWIETIRAKRDDIYIILIHQHRELAKSAAFQGDDHIQCLSDSEIESTLTMYLSMLLADKARSEPFPVAQDPYSKQVLKLAQKASLDNTTVLISGEVGVGKEVIAYYIHDHSQRAAKPLIIINCAVQPKSTLADKLFGAEENAFKQAKSGTLLLSEISELPQSLQKKILPVLQEQTIKGDIRTIATTDKDLSQLVAEGHFCAALYDVLNTFPIHWVPLRERPADIIPLAEYLLARNAKLAHQAVPKLSDTTKDCLLQYKWPGNGKEMDQVMKKIVTTQNEAEISVIRS